MKEKNYDYKKIGHFKWFVLENFPFIEEDFDAITNYQLFCKLGEYLNKTITKVNELGKTVETFTDFVSNYFENLDVQEEINNKLDEMAEDGTLEEIITSYINLKSILCYDTIDDMQNATNLVNGSYAKTLGFHSMNDGGGALYKIESKTIENVLEINGFDIISVNDTLLARLIYNTEMRFEQFGAYGDDTHDDTNVLKYCLESELDFNFKPLQKVYKLTDKIDININKSFDFNNCTLKQYGTNKEILHVEEDAVDLETNSTPHSYIKNVVLDCNSLATTGLYIKTWYKLYDNIKIKNIVNYGLYVESGYENQFGTIRLYGLESNTTSKGIYLNGSDSQFQNIYGLDVKTLIQVNNKFAIIDNIHAWIGHKTLSIGSKLIEFLGGQGNLSIKELYIDTYHYGIYATPDQTATNFLTIEKLFCIAHPTNFDFDNGNPYVFSQYNNGSTINYNIGVADVRAESPAKFITFSQTRDQSQTPSWNGILENSRFSSNVNSLNINTSAISVTNNLFSEVSVNSLKRAGKNYSFNFVGKVNSANFTHANTIIGNILPYNAPIENINAYCEITNAQYNAPSNTDLCYLFINSNGQVTVDIPESHEITNDDFIKIHISYVRV